ncbi:uncharacterized protein A1O9_12929 [Exophiala aquamarina CBS 119918]|uniref:Phosphatidylethanolamine-binding protein n=1 Tax=Exophiala aquamarina CBS 119918 TaxID=1182545 RepID=A0A072NVC2_9EURO|nr:uncharacterized protein A1O9_12929 [Exophiala aquamarina CBS 119918]KEF51003.1 hypothetical protein A1O9_12929 [Exophiala aquamarina CBS 119918]
MKYSYSLAVSALAVIVNAQSAPDFPIEVDERFSVIWADTTTRLSAGDLVPRDSILEAPELLAPNNSSSSETYLVFLIDQDVVPEGQDEKVEFLHWFQPNLAESDDLLTGLLAIQNSSDSSSATLPSASYLAPTPPGGSGVHRYTFVLYSQPDDFRVPATYAAFFADVPDLSNRLPFDIEKFAEDSGLGEPVAANWLRVLNGTAEETSIALTSTAAPTTTSSDSTNTASATTTSTSSGSSTGTATRTTSSDTAAATATGNSAGMMDARGNLKELVFGLAFGLVGMGLWL